MSKKIRVGIIFGGRSAEHEVSLQSAKNIIQALDEEKYEKVLIGIDKNGQWFLNDATALLLNADNPKLIALNNASAKKVGLVATKHSGNLISLNKPNRNFKIDVFFPVLHGPFGEDGTIQGIFKLFNVPFVGCSVLSSALGMDKDVQKRLLNHAGVKTAKFLCFREASQIKFSKVNSELGLPLFVKPANLGSSVGVSKVTNAPEFDKAIKEAFLYDSKILIEEYIKGREIECSVLGNDSPIASLPGEVIPTHEFYSYEAKYINENGAVLDIPANLPKATVLKVQETAIKAFKALCCEGMARVDMFLTESSDVLINEINTIPGFTKISMYPKLWEASGLPCKNLLDRLIELAIDRFKTEAKFKSSFSP